MRVQKRSHGGDLLLLSFHSEKIRRWERPPLRSNEDLYRYFSERWECAAPSTGVSSANPAGIRERQRRETSESLRRALVPVIIMARWPGGEPGLIAVVRPLANPIAEG